MPCLSGDAPATAPAGVDPSHRLRRVETADETLLYCAACASWVAQGPVKKLAEVCPGKLVGTGRAGVLKFLEWGIKPQKGAKLPREAIDKQGGQASGAKRLKR